MRSMVVMRLRVTRLPWVLAALLLGTACTGTAHRHDSAPVPSDSASAAPGPLNRYPGVHPPRPSGPAVAAPSPSCLTPADGGVLAQPYRHAPAPTPQDPGEPMVCPAQ